jgi:hypothetical protein
METPAQIMLAGAGIATGITAALAAWFWTRLRRVENSINTLLTPVRAMPIDFERPSPDLEMQLETVVSPPRAEETDELPYSVRSY